MSRRRAEQLGLQILGTVRAMVVAGVDPRGSVRYPWCGSCLNRWTSVEGYRLDEINEAFAAQVLACDRELHFDPEKLNVNGGAIAHGHPIVATGAILATKLLYEMKRTDAKHGLLMACVGGGQGIATLFER
jgi:acetyl-CoA C-acetyltransferase